MVTQYKYRLQKYSGPRSRHTCPSCGKKQEFTRYINNATNEPFPDHVGLCNRINSCGYHYTPKQFFADNPTRRETAQNRKRPDHEPGTNRPVDYLPFDIFDNSVGQYNRCNLFPFLERLFRESIAKWLCESYFVGADNKGNTVFWQVDITGKIRQAKGMMYNPATGRRNKEAKASFVGKRILGQDNANLQQCFFGEYLLSYPENSVKPVAIVESEKTAIIASVYYQQFVWLATGGIYGCKWTEKAVCKILSGKKVFLFPDLGAYDKWKEKGKLLKNVAGCSVVVVDILEKRASEADRKAGLDLADYLLKIKDSTGLALTVDPYPVMLDYKG